ncbi:MAG: RDD family protein [Desulfobulbaceae bacterium]|nr:RDD family protein [Desulfobulbaceae bacterium]
MEGEAGSPAALSPAGFWQRGMALAIDLMLLTALHCSFFLTLAYALIGIRPASLASALTAGACFLLFFFLAPLPMVLAYNVVMHACGGQTVGKILMNIRLVATDGTPISAGVAFLRLAAALLSLLPLGAGFLWVAISRKRLSWHDMIAGTMVVSAEQTS